MSLTSGSRILQAKEPTVIDKSMRIERKQKKKVEIQIQTTHKLLKNDSVIFSL